MTERAAGHRPSEADAYLADRIRQPYPIDSYVLKGSTPVVSFGDVRSAWVATLGLNPSDSEFVERDRWLTGDKQRFESLRTLGLKRPEDANDDQVLRILDACYGYFDGPNPFWKWFKPLERLLGEALEASYTDGSAAHLDLVQWATRPVWNKIPDKAVRRRLIEADRAFLAQQLAQESVRLVLMNGRTVMEQVAEIGVELDPIALPRTRGREFVIKSGNLGGTHFVGWNLTFPNGGISKARTSQIIDAVRDHGIALRPESGSEEASMTPITKDTTVTGKQELVALLQRWAETNEKTIGDVGSFGGRPWVRIKLGSVEVVLNADTKRAAVLEYLAYAKTNGADSPWSVIPNRSGTLNKVIFRQDGAATPGWYAYTTKPQPAPTQL